MDQSEKAVVTAKPPDEASKAEQGVNPPSLLQSATGSPDPASSMEASPLRDEHAQADIEADEHAPAEDQVDDEEEDSDESDSDSSEEESEEESSDEDDDQREQQRRNGGKVNFPQCPEMSLLPPRLTKKSKYVKENPKRENIFTYLLASIVVVFRKINLEDFGLSFPKAENGDKLSLKNIVQTFSELKDDAFKVPNFLTDRKQRIKFKHLISRINKGGKEGFNCLDCEITKKPRLNSQVNIPTIVNGHSMVAQLKRVLNERLAHVVDQLKKSGNTSILQSLNNEKTELTDVLRKLPSYEKFFIYSMKKSFTNLHVDFGGTFVYYYVMEGSKIFWIAPPTKENLEMYKRLEASGQDIWTHEKEFLMKNFERHELHAGDLAFIPTGYLHFVYTPSKSLVFGGNFLNQNKLKQHFEITRFEEECNVKAEKYKLFWDVQFAFVKYVFMEDINTQFQFVGSILPQSCMETGQLFLDELQKEIKTEKGGIYTSEEKAQILKKLQAALKKGKPRGKRSHPGPSQESPPLTLKEIEEMEAQQESKSQSSSTPSSSNAKRTRAK